MDIESKGRLERRREGWDWGETGSGLYIYLSGVIEQVTSFLEQKCCEKRPRAILNEEQPGIGCVLTIMGINAMIPANGDDRRSEEAHLA
jgi:hypothetical protein